MSLIHLLLLIYCALMIMAVIAWINNDPEVLSKEQGKQKSLDGISLIIPFRNEIDHLPALFESLKSQKADFPWEVILIDDHSTDSSLHLAQRFKNQLHNVKVVQLIEGSGKKNAIKQGVAVSSYAVILQMDADCTAYDSWVSTMYNHFNSDVSLLLGPIRMQDSARPWNWFNQIEAAILQSITAAGCTYNYPLMANGANMMYRKADYLDYQESQLGRNYQSGDDQFLLEFLAEKDSKKIKYLKLEDAIVNTASCSSWGEMVNQRARWAGKNKRWSGWRSALNLLLGLPQFGFILLLCFGIFEGLYFAQALNYFILKTCFEFALLYVSANFFDYKRLRYTPLFALLYPVFLLQVLFVSNQKISWKDRSID